MVLSRTAKPFAVAFTLFIATGASASSDVSAWEYVAQKHDLDPKLLLAVALQESRKAINKKAKHVAPHPYAIHLSGKAYYPKTKEEAMKIISKLSKCSNVDIGLMQINWKWHCDKVENVADLLNPFENLQVGSGILRKAMSSSPDDLILGIGRYHQWKDEKIARNYGRKVYAIYERLKPYKLGKVKSYGGSTNGKP